MANVLADMPAFTKAEAQQHTENVRQALVAMREAMDDLLIEAHDRQAHKALGYRSWQAYVEAEFGMTRRNAGYLLDRGRLAQAVQHALPKGNTVPSSAIGRTEAATLRGSSTAAAEIAADITKGSDPKAAVKKAVEKRRPKVIEATATDVTPPPPQEPETVTKGGKVKESAATEADRLVQATDVIPKLVRLPVAELAAVMDKATRREQSEALRKWAVALEAECKGYAKTARDGAVTVRSKSGK